MIGSILNKIKGFKTVGLTILVSLFSLLEATDLTNVVSAASLPYVILAVGAGNIVLRAISNTEIGKGN